MRVVLTVGAMSVSCETDYRLEENDAAEAQRIMQPVHTIMQLAPGAKA